MENVVAEFFLKALLLLIELANVIRYCGTAAQFRLPREMAEHVFSTTFFFNQQNTRSLLALRLSDGQPNASIDLPVMHSVAHCYYDGNDTVFTEEKTTAKDGENEKKKKECDLTFELIKQQRYNRDVYEDDCSIIPCFTAAQTRFDAALQQGFPVRKR